MIGINELFILLLGIPVGMILLSVVLWKTYGALRNSAIAGAAEALWEEIKQSGKCDYNFVLFLRPLFATDVLPIKQKLSLFKIIFTPDIILFLRLLAEYY